MGKSGRGKRAGWDWYGMIVPTSTTRSTSIRSNAKVQTKRRLAGRRPGATLDIPQPGPLALAESDAFRNSANFFSGIEPVTRPC
jgi:hypothetical protein